MGAGAGSPEHVVVAVYLWAHVGVVQDAPVTHHGTADAPGAPGAEAGQEQLLLGHWGEARHDLLHHCDVGSGGRGFHSEPSQGQGAAQLAFLPGLVARRGGVVQRQ